MAKIRLKVSIPKHCQQEPIVSKLVSHFGLVVNIMGAQINSKEPETGWFDLQLQGTVSQIHCGLAFLESLHLPIQSKPTTDGDGWYY